jgi:MFS family permease
MSRNDAFWRSAVLLAAAGLGQGLHISAFAPSVPQMAPTLAPGDQGVLLAQTAMTIPGLGMLLMGPVVGWIAERHGHRPVMLIGIITFMLSGLAGLVISSPWLLIISRFIVGVGATAMLTPTFALISYYFDSTTRDRLLGLSIGASAVVGIPCSLIAGEMVKGLGWRAPFMLFALAIFLLVGAFFVITDKEGRRTAIIPPPAPPGEKPPLAALFGVYVIGVWMAINGSIPVVQTPFLVSERGFTDPRDVALLVTSMSVGMIVASPLYGRLAAKFNTRALIALILGMFGIASAVTGLFTPLATAIAASTLSGIAATYILPTCASYIMTNLPSSTHGRAMGGLIGALFLGTFINQFVIYPLNAVIGRGSAFVLIGAVNGLGALIAFGLPLLRGHSPAGGQG